MIEELIERRIRHYAKLRDEAIPFIRGELEDSLRLLWQIDDTRQGHVLMESFIAQARDSDFFKDIHSQLSGKVNKQNLMALDQYRVEELDSGSLVSAIQGVITAVDSRLSGIVEPLKSMPYFYTQGKIGMNCQALAQLSAVLYSFDNDIADLSFAESVYTDRRDYFLDLLDKYKGLKDSSFYIVSGDLATSTTDPEYFTERWIEGSMKQHRESHFNSAGYGDQIKEQLLNMALAMEEPHGIIVNNRTGEEYDAYEGEERKYTQVPLAEGLYATSLLDIMFLRHFTGADNHEEYRRLRETYKHDSPTLSAAGSFFTEEWEEAGAYLAQARELYMKHGGMVPAKHVMLEMSHYMERIHSPEAQEEILCRLDYLKQEYRLDNCLDLIGQRFGMPNIGELEKILRR